MNEEQIQGSEDGAKPAAIHRDVMQILERGFEASLYGGHHVCGMAVNQQWMIPKLGCDSLQHVAEAIQEHLSDLRGAVVSNLETTSKLMRAQAFVQSDAAAATYQTLGQYRDALIKILEA